MELAQGCEGFSALDFSRTGRLRLPTKTEQHYGVFGNILSGEEGLPQEYECSTLAPSAVVEATSAEKRSRHCPNSTLFLTVLVEDKACFLYYSRLMPSDVNKRYVWYIGSECVKNLTLPIRSTDREESTCPTTNVCWPVPKMPPRAFPPPCCSDLLIDHDRTAVV